MAGLGGMAVVANGKAPVRHGRRVALEARRTFPESFPPVSKRNCRFVMGVSGLVESGYVRPPSPLSVCLAFPPLRALEEFDMFLYERAVDC